MNFQKKQILDEQEKSRKLQEFIAEYGKDIENYELDAF